ncbi:alpha/beta-hydrolase [Thozetella sp. PMI_491]|nr:alpha/beta-hydrolase [Thozetella sp. PMI_491]
MASIWPRAERLPSLDEICKHQAFLTAIWQLEPSQSGILSIDPKNGGPYPISWEVHGEGPVKLILIGGLGVTKTDYQNQTLYFGHLRGNEYSVLLVDNRGVGTSDKSFVLSGYSTTSMAQCILEVANHLGWTEPRQLHVGGGSMGGMISQEVGRLAPDRIASLSLLSTAAKIENTGNFREYLTRSFGMLLPKTLEKDIQDTATGCFPASWLHGTDDAEFPNDQTPRCKLPELGYGRFESNYARWAAQEVIKNRNQHFTSTGFWMQAMAAGKHGLNKSQLKELGDRVGRERILVLHGDDDQMISVELGKRLIANLQPGRSIIAEGLGHAPIQQRPRWLNGVLEEQMKNGETQSGR